MRKGGKGQCRVWSGSCYADAAPLRRGSPFCHHHRVRCLGQTLAGMRCTVTSSSEHAHADPLRQGEQFCMHHSARPPSQLSEADAPPHTEDSHASDSFELYEEDICDSDQVDSDGEWLPDAKPRKCRTCGDLCRFCECGGAQESDSEPDSEDDLDQERWSDDEHYNVGFSWGQD
mmetsp:Transcript_64977/g.128456  ORF Transcript_64977/g.128456 Transcript_64977/m.128456 type:complete len:174 (+) Transcript_64977:1392-1913(+)